VQSAGGGARCMRIGGRARSDRQCIREAPGAGWRAWAAVHTGGGRAASVGGRERLSDLSENGGAQPHVGVKSPCFIGKFLIFCRFSK
jgi:hypothetical protein